MTLKEAIGRLKTYEERIKYKKGKQVDNQEKLTFTRHENKGKYFRGRGCGKHKFSQGRNHENFKEEKKDEETSHMKDEEQEVSLHEKDVGYKETNMDSLWYLDNGASNHKTGVREHFKELDEEVSGKVRFEDGLYIEIKGKGSILIECDDEKQRIISHVYYILDLKSNLLSLGQFTKIGCKVVMEDNELRLYDIDNKIFMKVTRQRNRLYKANLRIGFQPIEEDNEFPNNDDDDYASPIRYYPLHSQTPHTPSTRSSKVNSQVTPNFSTQSYYQRDNESIQIIDSPSHFDHTPVRGFRILNDLYENTEELLLAEDEPRNYKEASSDQKWIEAMKTKKDANENIIKHKARLVEKGYIQQHGIDFKEVFAPVARMETVRLLLAIAVNNKWEVHHLDVKFVFLHGDLKEEVYVTQPKGFIKRQDNEKVYRLIKALYGPRQAPHAWNIKLDNTLKSLNFKKYALEQAIYTKTSKDSTLLIGVYVDDLIITDTPKEEIDKFKAQMEEKFKMSDIGLLAYYLDCNETWIPMDPGTRLTKTMKGAMVNSTKHRSLIGCLRYLLHTRPDLSYYVRLLSRFMQEPREQYMKAIRKVLGYVKGTKDYGITYKHNRGNKIHGYSDSSYGVNTQERKGTTGIIFYYGESPISWSTQKQATVALSSCESEFIAATAAATQALWLKRLLSKLTHSKEDKVTIKVDNKFAIALMKNLVFHERSKHIDTKYHFIKECIKREDIQFEFVNGEYQKVDILTKALPKIKFLTMRQLIGLKDLSHNVCD
uniref:Ribonuclease H-like domain, reverse transcriptase, RNA-dependent DNA polymerase n=1 Tax=Tanacetum cinerariifolium TaxID=118510 RepID=A0A6L2KYH1_TANCI|nr:ribonuclease H-like domain, reverse transcriptase, RNA-dependent DNA polymerase [Tanacetum cinerariifolium]